MDILKIFNLYDNEIKINIIGTVDNPLFQANQIGKLLGLRNIRETIKNFDEDEKKDNVITADAIGRNQNTTFLTENGLYRLLGMSRKEEARVFQKWICNVIKEIRLTGKYELDSEKDDDRKMYERKIELERHKTLISSLDKKKVLYICILDNHKNIKNSDCSIYKIGWSNNFKRRLGELEKTYGPVTVLYMYECNNNSDFEKFLFTHKKVACHKYNDKITKINTRELFLLSPDNLYDILEIIKKNIDNFLTYNNDEYMKLKELDKDNKKLTLENNKVKLEILKLSNNNTENIDENISIISDFEEEIDDEEFNEKKPYKKIEYEWQEGDTLYDVRKRDNSKSPYIQKYDPNTLELLETYDSLIDLIRENENMSRSGLKVSVKSNTIYNGYRWFFVKKSEPNIKYDLEHTNEIKTIKYNEFIAMIDIDKKNIVEVFPSQKHASIARKFTNSGAISQALKKGNISSGHYWMRYDDCSDELKTTYKKELPEKNKNNNSKKVELIHKTTKEIIKVFDSVDDVLKEFQMSRLTLNKFSNNKEPYKGFYFNILS